jgi:hypothetical protein
MADTAREQRCTTKWTRVLTDEPLPRFEKLKKG